MNQLTQKHATKVRFGLIGIINTALDFGLLFGLTNLGLPKITANTISTSIAFIFSFFANKKYTFKSNSKNIVREIALFTIVTLFGLWVLQGTVLYTLVPILVQLGLSETMSLFVAKFLATIVSLIWNYLLYSRVVFKNSSEK